MKTFITALFVTISFTTLCGATVLPIINAEKTFQSEVKVTKPAFRKGIEVYLNNLK